MTDTTNEMRDTFFDRLDDTRAGMLSIPGADRFIPMSHYADRAQGEIYFITAKGTDLVNSLNSGSQKVSYIVSDAGEGIYADISGELSLSDDRAKLDEIWNAIASSWFEGGKMDEDVQLVRMRLERAEIWATGGALRFFYQIARAKITGAQPDMGENYEIRF